MDVGTKRLIILNTDYSTTYFVSSGDVLTTPRFIIRTRGTALIRISLFMATFLLVFDYFLQFLHEVSFQSHQYVMVKTSGWPPRDNPAMSAIKLELLVLLILQDSAQKVARIATFLRSGNGVMHVLHSLFQDNQQGSELKSKPRKYLLKASSLGRLP